MWLFAPCSLGWMLPGLFLFLPCGVHATVSSIVLSDVNPLALWCPRVLLHCGTYSPHEPSSGCWLPQSPGDSHASIFRSAQTMFLPSEFHRELSSIIVSRTSIG
eukprot:g53437.t1